MQEEKWVSAYKLWACANGKSDENIAENLLEWFKKEGKQYFNYDTIYIKDPDLDANIKNAIKVFENVFSGSDIKFELTSDNTISITADCLFLYPEEVAKLAPYAYLITNLDVCQTNDGLIRIDIGFKNPNVEIKTER